MRTDSPLRSKAVWLAALLGAFSTTVTSVPIELRSFTLGAALCAAYIGGRLASQPSSEARK